MDGLNCMAARERELEIDLESGGSVSEEDSSSEPESKAKVHGRKNFSRLRNGFTCFNGSIDRGCSFSSNCNSTKYGKPGVDESKEFWMDKSSEGEKRREHLALVEKKNVKEKVKKNGKIHKPPRPPKGPLLDAADKILVKEITELALKKRATVERMKALKKMKAEKSSSFSSSLPALFITLLFFIVIIFQGMSAKGSAVLPESALPSVGGSEGFISVQHFRSPYKVNGPHSRFHNFTEEQTSDSGVVEVRSLEDLTNH